MAKTRDNEVVTTDGKSEVAEALGFNRPLPVDRFEELAAEAAVLDSVEAVLSDAEAKAALQGVPIIITKLVYRDDSANNKGQYVSMECVVGPNAGKFPKNSVVVINDGSTGAFRQVTSYIEALGLVKLPDGPSTGKAGETRFDAPFEKWEWADAAVREGYVEVRLTEEGAPVIIHVTLPRPFMCRHGVRLSEHSAGTTTYLA